MFEHRIFTDFVYLMVVIEPISLVPEFLSVTPSAEVKLYAP